MQKYPQMPPLVPCSSPAAAVTVMLSVWQDHQLSVLADHVYPSLAGPTYPAAPFHALIDLGRQNAFPLELMCCQVQVTALSSHSKQTRFERGHSVKVCYYWSLVKLDALNTSVRDVLG